jgi:hypothetical protein
MDPLLIVLSCKSKKESIPNTTNRYNTTSVEATKLHLNKKQETAPLTKLQYTEAH